MAKRELTKQQKTFAGIKGDGVYTVRAVAGSGKTFTAEQYIKNNPNERILYLVFNASNRAEMTERLEESGITNVTVHTLHSFCYQRTVGDRKSKYHSEIKGRKFDNLSPYDVMEYLGVTFSIANSIIKIYTKYLHSEYNDISEVIDTLENIPSDKAKNALNKLALYLNHGVEVGEISRPHDFYVKYHSIHGSMDSYDTIIVDEAQDISPVMLAVIDNKVSYNKLIFVGDGHQWIYGWRNAINAMEVAKTRYENVKCLELSCSFRVGKEIAKISEMLNGVEVIGSGKNTAINPEDMIKFIKESKHMAVLGFTNSGLFGFYINNMNEISTKKLFFRNFDSRPIWNMINFAEGNIEKVNDKHLLKYGDFSELLYSFRVLEGVIDADPSRKVLDINSEHLGLLRLIVRYTPAFLKMALMKIKNSSVKYEGEEDILLTTVHTCKGSEFDNMILLDDYPDMVRTAASIFEAENEDEFINFARSDEEKYGREGMNVFYVAITRAKGNVLFTDKRIYDWYKGIEG